MLQVHHLTPQQNTCYLWFTILCDGFVILERPIVQTFDQQTILSSVVAALTSSPVEYQPQRPGRPLTLYACPHCFVPFGARKFNEHLPRCAARFPLCLRKPTRQERAGGIRLRTAKDEARIANYLYAELPGAAGSD